jgi:hypothetical protein
MGEENGRIESDMAGHARGRIRGSQERNRTPNHERWPLNFRAVGRKGFQPRMDANGCEWDEGRIFDRGTGGESVSGNAGIARGPDSGFAVSIGKPEKRNTSRTKGEPTADDADSTDEGIQKIICAIRAGAAGGSGEVWTAVIPIGRIQAFRAGSFFPSAACRAFPDKGLVRLRFC